MFKLPPKVFILDVDGVLTSGQFYYTAEGKTMKVFGPDDNDALGLIKPWLDEILFVTGDERGLPITQRRIDDMGYPLALVSTTDRLNWIKDHYDLDTVIYMGDGIFDYRVMQEVRYSIAPFNADSLAREHASYVCERRGGDRAVAEACLHLLKLFFVPWP